MSALAPPRIGGLVMGVWFLATSLGNLMAGQFAGRISGDASQAMPGAFLQVVVLAGIGGIILLCLARPLRRLAAGAE